MKKFPESEYFLIKVFRKVPFARIAFMIILFYIAIYIAAKYILGIEHPSSIEILRFYLGNSLFSIGAMWCSVKVYEQSVNTIDEWINENDILVSKNDIINKLNRVHNFFYGRYQVVIVGSITGVIIRRLVIYFWNMQDSTGNIIIDTITIFLILLLLLVSIDALYCVYAVGLNGIKVKYPFEISNAYRGLASVARTNTIIVSLYLAFYGYAVVFWAYQYNTKVWSYLINILFLVGIIIVFYIVNSGIRHGIAMSKQAILSEIKYDFYRGRQADPRGQ